MLNTTCCSQREELVQAGLSYMTGDPRLHPGGITLDAIVNMSAASQVGHRNLEQPGEMV